MFSLQDIRYGARALRKNPSFTLAAIAILILGIGGNAAIFTITNALLLRPLPYQQPLQLMLLGTRQGDNSGLGPISLNRFDLLRERQKSFSGVAVFTNDSLALTGRGEPQQVPVARVSPNLFPLLGIKPQLGRMFTEDEGQPSGKPVVMLTDSFWHSRFGGDRKVVGQVIDLDSTPYTIIGVLPAGVQFPFLGPAEIWSPRYFEITFMNPQQLRAGVGYLKAIARLKPESSLESATSEMDVFNKQYKQQFPAAASMGIGGLQDLTVANLRLLLILLSVAVGVVLLIACANVASLLLSRALARRREIAVRAALGASRKVIIWQLLTESVMLALIGGLLGLGLGFVATRYLATIISTNGQNSLALGFAINIDWRVMFFTLVVSVLTGLGFGIVPALQLSRTNINQTLREEGRASTGGHHQLELKGALVVGQVALSLVLLIVASVLLRSFSRLLSIDPGFDPHKVLTMKVSLPTVKYSKSEQQVAFFGEMLRKVSAVPGVTSAAMSAALPLHPIRVSPILPEGQPEVPLAERPFTIVEVISPGWFRTMHAPMKRGRDFTEGDNNHAPNVVIVNESLARRYWMDESPLGKHILVGRQPTPAEIVGVAADLKNYGLAVDPQPQLYLPFPQLPWGNMNLLVRTSLEPHAVASAVRAQISAIDPDQPVTGIQSLEELLDDLRAQPRSTIVLLAIFSATALTLAIVGLYGVLAYLVAQRRQELGIRLALGADKANIMRLVIEHGLRLTVIGIGIGVVLALGIALMVARLGTGTLGISLYKSGWSDLPIFIVAPLAFLSIALLACYLPARQATRVDPAEALRL
jgi:putative ABC transport system permease protein